MDRVDLGLRLQQWHSGQSDPIYAVGSFYVGGDKYPKKSIVKDALHNLNKDLNQHKKMLAGEKVSVYNDFYGKTVPDLRKFAGYTDEMLQENIADLEEIVEAINIYLKKDY